jgi:hypothetical protein
MRKTRREVTRENASNRGPHIRPAVAGPAVVVLACRGKGTARHSVRAALGTRTSSRFDDQQSLLPKSAAPGTPEPRFRSPVLSSCCAFRHVPAKSLQPIQQRAQAREGEAETLRLSLRCLDGSSFTSFLSVFTQVLRKSWRKVTQKSVSDLNTRTARTGLWRGRASAALY